MDNGLLEELDRTSKKCSDCLLHPEYEALLRKLESMELTRETVDFLCDNIASKKHIWEIRFRHLQVLLRNPSAGKFDLKEFYLQNFKRSRRIAIKIFFIRGYAQYASEEELIPIMEKFLKNLDGPCGHTDYNYMLSVAGLPYLVKKYGYACFAQTLEEAKRRHNQSSPLLRDYFTLDENLDQVNLVSPQEAHNLIRAFLDGSKTGGQ